MPITTVQRVLQLLFHIYIVIGAKTKSRVQWCAECDNCIDKVSQIKKSLVMGRRARDGQN